MQCRCFVLHTAGAAYLVYKLIFKGHLSVLIIVIRMWSRAGRYMAVGVRFGQAKLEMRLRIFRHTCCK